ncbi:MAG: nucleotide sugar dehydrogenase [Persephonella sp.]|nr:MAG: nucleotide sugar dehydrogenase [Persephonella sp.]
MKITVIGAGYVGLVTAACLSEVGHEVMCVEKLPSKLEILCRGMSPIYEPGLNELLQKNMNENRLFFTDKIEEGIKFSDVIFLCVGTPQGEDGKADLSQVEEAVRQIAENMDGYKLIVEKSTVPVNTHKRIEKTVKRYLKDKNIEFDVASNPEFLREGSAVYDFMNPDRIVVGVNSERAKKIMEEIYKPFTDKGFPLVITNTTTAELIKYASNSFLAMKISYINMIADLCEKVGADIKEVAKGMGYDKRIGSQFLNAGIGYGGSCFSPDEIVFVRTDNGIETLTFEELFKKGKGESIQGLKILSAEEDEGLKIVNLDFLTVREYEDYMLEINLSMGRKIKITKDHPVLVLKDNEIKTVLAEELEVGDELVFPFLKNDLEEREVLGINLIDELEKSDLLEDVLLHSLEFIENFDYIKENSSNKYQYDIKRVGTVRLREVINIKESVYTDLLSTIKNRKAEIPSKIRIDGDFARFLGYYSVEGFIIEDLGRNGKVRKRIGLTFNKNEYEYIGDVKGILNRLGIHFTEKIEGNAHTIFISSRIFGYLLENVLKAGRNSDSKAVPPQILISNRDIRREYLKGLFRGNGSIVKANKGKNLYIDFATVSRKLANGVILLLQMEGIIASVREKFYNKSKVLTYNIRINGYENVRRIGELFGKKWERYKNILSEYKREISPIGYRLKKNYAVLKIKDIKSYHYKGNVYSLESYNFKLISSYGLFIHNCFPKDVKAFIKIAEDYGLDFSLLKDTDDINKNRRKQFVKKIEEALWVVKDKNIAIWGLSFKPNTDDIREAPSIDIVNSLLQMGANLKLYDPQAREHFQALFPESSRLKYAYDKYDAVKYADGLVILTEWDEFKNVDFEKIKSLMHTPIIIDGRNIYDLEDMKKYGFEYYSIGRQKLD